MEINVTRTTKTPVRATNSDRRGMTGLVVATDSTRDTDPSDESRQATTTLDIGHRTIGALMSAPAAEVAKILEYIADTDLDDPYLRELLETIRTLALEGKGTDGALVGAELHRTGKFADVGHERLIKRLIDTITAGANPFALRQYAAALVAESYRLSFALLGETLTEFSRSQPEAALLPYLVDAGTRLRAHSNRLAALRGDE
ncbi:DnaB-like helicase N-terminal domain-containing protein [Rhodococcus sp. NPDC056960]|uniref:DnaB-like helicase N-terminal domain-containing protein n=1 Tax=Rhodococcus sp. NPDC056960 TaxID=3345982 RepID=UPI003645BD3F